MDIFLLPPSATDTDESGTWASAAGVKALIPLVDLAGSKAKPARVCGFFPDQASPATEVAMIEALRTIRASCAAEIRAAAPVTTVREDLLERLREAGLVDIALYCPAEESAAAEAAVHVAAAFSGKHPATRFRWRLWLEPSRSTSNLARVSLLQGAGLPFEAVEIDALFPGIPTEPEGWDVPPLEHFADVSCNLYEGTLTFNGRGNLTPCPRMPRAPVVTASLLGHSPQALLQRKGGQAGLVGRCDACLACRSRGRFEWPPSTSQTLADWMTEGKRQAEAEFRAGTARPSGPLGREIEDLGALTPEQQREEVERFEAQLKEWSAGMGGWEDGRSGG